MLRRVVDNLVIYDDSDVESMEKYLEEKLQTIRVDKKKKTLEGTLHPFKSTTKAKKLKP